MTENTNCRNNLETLSTENYKIACNKKYISFNYAMTFGLSEKHTKFEKIIPMVLTNQLIYLKMSKPPGRFFQIMCASHKVRTLIET